MLRLRATVRAAQGVRYSSGVVNELDQRMKLIQAFIRDSSIKKNKQSLDDFKVFLQETAKLTEALPSHRTARCTARQSDDTLTLITS